MLRIERRAAADSILESLPNRIHQVIEPYVAATPDSVALSEDVRRQFARSPGRPMRCSNWKSAPHKLAESLRS
jgi:hypothetical protein